MFGADDVALATLDEHRLLCAHREGPYGVRHWNRQVEKWLSEETGQPPWSEWYPGRPLLVTANDYGLRVYNGDTGVVIAGPDGLRAVIAGAGGPLDFATSRLSDVETMHAMTIHKSQGSQADEVTVLMPTEDSRLVDPRVVLHRGDSGEGARCGWSGRRRPCGPRSNGGRSGRQVFGCGCSDDQLSPGICVGANPVAMILATVFA